VVGIDGSPGSAAALRWATGVARAAGAEVIAVHVIEPPEYDIPPLGLPRALINEADWREAIQGELEGTWCEPMAEAGVRHRMRVEEGHACPCLAAIARHEHAGLVVTGRCGLSGIADLVQGSVSYYVAHHAPCPVAVVPAEPQAA
jgi:nucleotide-binding universal stress UspA family protein